MFVVRKLYICTRAARYKQDAPRRFSAAKVFLVIARAVMGSGNWRAHSRSTLVTFNGGALVIWRSLSDYFIYLFVAFPLHRVEPVLGDPLNFIVAAVNFAAVNVRQN
jgi:hypothetical protein